MTAPANDNFSGAATVDIHGAVAYVSAAIDNTDATVELGEWATGGYRTLWWNYTPLTSGTAVFDTALTTGGDWPDTVIVIYTGDTLGTVEVIDFNDEYGENSLSQVTLPVTAAVTYRIQVGMYDEADTALVVLRVTGPATYPPVSAGAVTSSLAVTAHPALIPAHGVTAAVIFTANPAPWTPDSIVTHGVTATATVTAVPGVLAVVHAAPVAALTFAAPPTAPHGDTYATAVPLLDATGTGVGTLLGATRETGEPESAYGDADTGTTWYILTPAGPGAVSFSVTAATGQRAVLEIYDGDSVDALELVVAASADPTLTATSAVTFIASEGVPYYIRVHQHTTNAYPMFDYSYTVTGRVDEFTLTLADATLAQTPATVRVSVTNGTPDAAVEFTLGPDVIWTDELDETGILTDVAIPLDAMDAGSYTLVVTETVSTLTDDVTFTVAEDPLPYPTDLPADTEPVLIPQTGVRRWVIQDPAPGGTNWTFPHNPAEMTSPFAVKNITVEVTVAEDGQPVTFHGADKPRSWEFRGWLDNQSLHDTLAGYAATNRRYYLIDHRARAWVVTFEHFDAEAQIKPNLPWAHTYTMHCLIYSGPVQL